LENIEVKILSEELINDYLNYFENKAFYNNNEWGSGCYCIHYHILNDNDININRKNTAIELIKNKTLCGYLAYKNGNVIGWCNAGEKSSFKRLNDRQELLDLNNINQKIISIVCYLIFPEMRGKGVPKILLENICLDAKNKGYSYIEVYPSKKGGNCFEIYHGTKKMYEKYGFSVYKELENEFIMRKKLN